ncbi:MAG: ABC transporter substrate-binding protein [Betaproteobacteria bacterium]
MKNERRTILKGLAGVLAAQQAPALLAQPARATIGQSAPLTGSNAPFGKATVAGARAWFANYNRSASVPVDHLVLDDGNDTARSGPNGTALIERGASALFGFASATLSLPALPAAKSAGVPFFAPFTGATVIHNASDPLIFTARASYANEAAKFIEVLKGFGINRIEVAHFADRVGNENRDVVVAEAERAGIKSVAIATERNKSVADDTVRRMLAERPQAVIFTTSAPTTAELIKKGRAAGLSKAVFLVTLSFAAPSQVQDLLGPDAAGLVVSFVVPKPWGNEPIVVEHSNAMRAIGGGEAPSFASLESYMAARALTTAIDRARSTRPAAIAAAPETVDLDLGGYRLKYSRANRNGSSFVDYMILGVDFVRKG